MKNRIGRFSIDAVLLRDDPEAARAVMGCCVIVRAERMWHVDRIDYIALSNYFDYIALSNYFDEVPRGSEVPEYEVVILREVLTDEDGYEYTDYDVLFKRVTGETR